MLQNLAVGLQAWAESVSAHVALEMPALQKMVLSTFAALNTIRVVAYLPQILRAARDTNGATAISCLTWGLFCISHITTIAYSVLVLGDALMAAIFLGNALACLAIIGVTILKRRSHHRLKNGPL